MTAPQAFGGNPNWAQDESRKGIANAFGGRSATTQPDEFQPSPFCLEKYKAWEPSKEHGAFAVSKLGGCAWAVARSTTDDAIQYIMNECAKMQRTCKIVATK